MPGALAALKKKKLLENQLEATENNIARINEQQGMLEEQRAQVVQLQAMKNAAQASKQTMQVLTHLHPSCLDRQDQPHTNYSRLCCEVIDSNLF